MKSLPIMPTLCSKLDYYASIILDALVCMPILHNWHGPSMKFASIEKVQCT